MIAAGVIVLHKNSVLLAKRAETYKGKPVPFGGYWSIFTGALDKEDLSILHTAQRELQEETQITVSLKDLDYTATIDNPGCTLNIYAYESSELIFPILDDEHTEFGWFSIEALKTFTEKIDQKVLECIYSYKDNSNTSK
jgi:8-oxo-dGTP pyrophosphatase MutT (NUDIX family)